MTSCSVIFQFWPEALLFVTHPRGPLELSKVQLSKEEDGHLVEARYVLLLKSFFLPTLKKSGLAMSLYPIGEGYESQDT